MSGLWVASAALTLIVVAAFLWWVRRIHDTGPDRYDARLAVFRDRRAELDAELDAGRIGADEHAQAIGELEALAAQELEEGDDRVTSAERWPLGTTLTLAVAIPLIAFLMYGALGGHGDAQRAAMPPATAGDLAQLVDQLAVRMEATPDDLQGWMLLGRSSVVLGEYDRAVRAWRQAQRLAPDDPTVLANLAEALVMVDDTALDGEAGILIEQALAGDPTNPKALWYGGILAERRGEELLARERWTVLLQQEPPEEFRRLIEQRLGDAFSLSVVPVVDGTNDGVLFVTLHAEDVAGPPLAAVRAPVDAAAVVIGSRDTMLPGTDLGTHERLRVSVRVSASGTVERQPGDRYGEAIWARGDPTTLTVRVDRTVD